MKSGLWCALMVTLISGAGARVATASTILPDRGTLDSLLRSGASHEDFEGFAVDPFGAMVLDVPTLDAETIAKGQGPGLIVPGVTVYGAGGLQWNGHGYFGQPSRTLSGATTLELDFAGPVTAFGLDLLVFAHYPDVAMVSVFGPDDSTLLGTFGVAVFDPSFEMFFGLADPGGIGRVAVAGTVQPWSPVVDDLTFGAQAVPEPGAALLIVAGAAAWRIRRRARPKP